MKDQLIDVSIKTMVGQLPQIITKNNEYITAEFNNIYNSANDTLVLPKIDTTINPKYSDNYIKSHTGKFTYITTNTITLENYDELSKHIIHGLLEDRFVDTDMSSDNKDTYAHDGRNICIQVGEQTYNSLQDVLDGMQSKLDNVYNIVCNSNNENNNTEQTYGASLKSISEPNSFTFDDNVLFASSIQLKRMNLPKYQYNDIKSGILYTYYDYDSVLTITDEHTSSIKGFPNSIVRVGFNDTKTKAYYRIILSRKDQKYLRISKDELVRLSLICVSNTDEYGTEWDVYDYSVRNADDLIIERK